MYKLEIMQDGFEKDVYVDILSKSQIIEALSEFGFERDAFEYNRNTFYNGSIQFSNSLKSGNFRCSYNGRIYNFRLKKSKK